MGRDVRMSIIFAIFASISHYGNRYCKYKAEPAYRSRLNTEKANELYIQILES